MNGSIFKRCPCTGKQPGKEKGKTCANHGSWYFVHDLPGGAGRRPQHKRGGFATKQSAENELARSLARYAQRGVAAERDMRAGRQKTGDYLRAWGDGKAGLKASTRRSYRIHVENYLIPLLGELRLDELGTGHIEAQGRVRVSRLKVRLQSAQFLRRKVRARRQRRRSFRHQEVTSHATNSSALSRDGGAGILSASALLPALLLVTPASAATLTAAQAGSTASWAAVSAGACARSTDGTLWCWGTTAMATSVPATTTSRLPPARMGSAASWAIVSERGGDSTCALKTDGTLWCWGE
jgi:hypothetical protein